MFFEGKGGARDTRVESGPWAWFRFLDQAQREPVTAEKMIVTFDSKGRKVRYEVNTAYLTRYQELLMTHRADHGALPPGNAEEKLRLGRLSPL